MYKSSQASFDSVPTKMNSAQYRKQFSRNCTHCNYKVILLGDYGVGKTSLFHRIKSGKQFHRQKRTVSNLSIYEDSIDYCSRTFTVQGGREVQVNFWDTGSAERFRGSLTGNYYKAATGVVLMYDATDPSSLTSLRNWMEDAETYTHNATFLLLGNKYDTRGKESSYQVDGDLSNAFAKNKEIPLHFKISTEHSDDDVIMRVFQTLAEHMHRKVEQSSINQTRADFQLTCAMTDTVALFADTQTRSSSTFCGSCSKR